MRDAFCALCFDEGETFPSVHYPGEELCREHKNYETWWESLTPAQRAEDHRMAERHCELEER